MNCNGRTYSEVVCPCDFTWPTWEQQATLHADQEELTPQVAGTTQEK